jgi:ribosomal protein S18 acetylase RimI-like enzyme
VTALREATTGDVEAIVAIHRAAFPSSFLTSLGPRFLAHLYTGYLDHPSGILLVAAGAADAGGEAAAAAEGVAGMDGSSGPVRGFVAGTTEPEAFYAWLRRTRGPAMSVVAVPALARRPLVVGRRLVSAIRYRGEAPQTVGHAALLASLGVDPGSSGGGLGSRLVEGFVARALEASRPVTYLSTDVAGNDRVLEFYRRNGFHEAERLRRPDGREMAVLIRTAHTAADGHTEVGAGAAGLIGGKR